ncbi:GntR family transcriptional regulator [Kushneria indalinina]|uniref:GntR family transcriptional regulator n=1 Tax=Kushneria indalinina DSM 14324 TaxID=1122140 RepID=A0A3D9DS94_9GAMM|nr:GntR family transcriptional regulator [Kushneria indalinina]REC93612.1 GntR family transcriptional regulator [Kushneria indalinina DSM 14324]
MNDTGQFHLLAGLATGRETRSDDAIYQALWEAIVEHRLSPGARLPEDALAGAFGVSRTMIRRVLQRLALEQLVTLRAHRGAQITSPTPSEARDVFRARRLLEGALLAEVVTRLTPEDLKALTTIADQEHHASREQAIRLSARFHTRLMAVAGNASLSEALSQLISRTSLIIAVYGRHRAGCPCEHPALIDLLATGELAAIQHWMQQHLADIEASLDFTASGDALPDFEHLFGHHREPSAS